MSNHNVRAVPAPLGCALALFFVALAFGLAGCGDPASDGSADARGSGDGDVVEGDATTDAPSLGDAGDDARDSRTDADFGRTDTGPDGGTDSGTDPTDDACLDDFAYWEQRIWRGFASVNCAGCHVEGGLAGASAFVLTPGSDGPSLRASFDAMSAMAGERAGGTSILLLKPTGQHPDGHGGGIALRHGSSEYRALETFVARLEGRADTCDDPSVVADCSAPWPGHRRVRRLNATQYQNTVRDIFGAGLDFRSDFAQEAVVHGYDNNAAALIATPLLVEQWLEAAELIADAVVPRIDTIAACNRGSDGDMGCLNGLITTFGARAFRRPLTTREADRYRAIFEQTRAWDGADQGMRDVIVAMLVSPHFLYRSELGVELADGRYALTPHEIATQLSYLLTDSTPDALLLADAANGRLAEPEVVAEHARRLLRTPAGTQTAVRFLSLWLDIPTLEIVTRDPTLFPEFDEGIRRAMLRETEAYLTSIYDGGEGSVDALLRSTHTFADDRLASFYGFAGGAPSEFEGLQRFEFDDGSRYGVLTQGSVLTGQALPTGSSPIHRGLLVRERMLCQELPPPPPGISADPPPLDPNLTTRERFAQHSDDTVCAGCHRLVDPIGFAFDHYDGVGRYRATEQGLEIDVSGEIVEAPNTSGTFHGLIELADILAESDDVHACFREQHFVYFYGHELSGEFACTARQLETTYQDNGQTIAALLLGLTETPHFWSRAPDDMTPQMWTETYGARPPGPDDDVDAGGVGDAGPPDAGPDADTGLPDAGTDASPDTGIPDTPVPDPPGGAVVEVSTTSDWGAGYCVHVDVSNPGSAELVWRVDVSVDGTINDLWNAVVVAEGAMVTFEGREYNRVIAAGAATSFGFCAQR